MYIAPNTNVIILKNCPINANYEHTLFFNSLSEQYTYFISLQKYRLQKQSYQRKNDNYMRVQIKAENLFDCNYMMFQNESFGDKWFYAFITNIEYVSNTVSEISYNIDVMQSWFFDYEIKPCLIDREHSATDVIGENIIPEPINVGEYETTAISSFDVSPNSTQNTCVFLMAQPFPLFEGYPPGNYGGTYIPAWIYRFVPEQLQNVLDYINQEGLVDSVISISLLPNILTPSDENIRINYLTGATLTTTITPKNKKIYTYPYTELIAYCNGNSKELRYEQFTGTPSFTIRTTFGANLPTVMTPNNYEGEANNIKYQLTINSFPLLPYIKDYYQTWLAYNKSSIIGKSVSAIATGATSLITGNIGGGLNAFSSAVDIVSSIEKAKVMPDEMKGSAEGFDVNFVSGFGGFYTYCRSAKQEFAQIIDDFFTMYGYATKSIKVPNRDVRPHWCYTKTVNCIIVGSMAQNDINRICNIYNSGITFWKNGNEVGDYSLDNSV